MTDHPPVIVHPLSPTGGRRVTIGNQIAGLAMGPGDVFEFLRRAGLDPDAVDLSDPALIEWRGGDLGEWGPGSSG